MDLSTSAFTDNGKKQKLSVPTIQFNTDRAMMMEDEDFTCSPSSQSELHTPASHVQTASMPFEQVANDIRNMREGLNQLLAREAQLKRSESLASANQKLQVTNERLQENVKELETRLFQAKEAHLIEKSHLEVEMKASQREALVRIQGLEEARTMLERQTTLLQQEKANLGMRMLDLEAELHVVQEKLEQSKVSVEALQSTNSSEKALLTRELQLLKDENENAKCANELKSAKDAHVLLEQKIIAYEQMIENLENIVLPESEGQLQNALKELEHQSKASMDTEQRLLTYQARVHSLEAEIVSMKERMEKEHQNLQSLNEDNVIAVEWVKRQVATKDKMLEELVEQVEELKRALTNEKEISAANDTALKQMKAAMETRIMERDNALAETMTLLENTEKKERQATQMLEDTTARLEKEIQVKEATIRNVQMQEKSVLSLEGTCNRLEATCKPLEEETMEQKLRIKELECQLKLVSDDRDYARSRMENYYVREEELLRKLRENDRIRRHLHNRVIQLCGNIRVFVRVRPPLTAELDEIIQQNKNKRLLASGSKRKHEPIMDEDEVTAFHFPGLYQRDDSRILTSVDCQHGVDDITKNLIEIVEPYKDRGGLSDRRKKWRFGFDRVFTSQHGQEEVWEATAPLVQSAIDGYNVTIFAYGQTGSGKTYTMLGGNKNEGLIGRSVAMLFEAKREMEAFPRVETTVDLSVEILEIYNEHVRDLLAPPSVDTNEQPLRVTSSEVVGNERVKVSSCEAVSKILKLAQERRCVKATRSNAESSRSHLLFTIHFNVTTTKGSANGNRGGCSSIQQCGKLNIYDLAGSERLDKSGSNAVAGGALLKETQQINKSLSTLSNVIERLQARNPNVPFRESKLTLLLRNSLEGNSKTLVIVCCNPLVSHFHESLCSLRFASKVSKVDLKAVAHFSC